MQSGVFFMKYRSLKFYKRFAFLQVGNTQQSINQICENIDAFVKGLKENFPGKWGNVKSLHIGVTNGISVPIYVAIVLPNSIKIPKVKLRPDNRKRAAEEGELSTLPDGYKVTVLPDGTVKVKKPPKAETSEENEELSNEEEEFFDEDEVSDMDDDGEVSDTKEDEVKQEENATESESEEDSGVEAAEEAYLQELTIENNESKKKRKGAEEQAPPKKIQKKMKGEESLTIKNINKKVSDSKEVKSVKTLKGKDTDEEKLLLGGKCPKKGRSVPSSMQWHVEELDDKPTKQNKSKTKVIVKEKSTDKSSVSKSGVVSEPKEKVKVESEVESVEKQVKKKCTGLPSDAVNGKEKKSKLGKVKKG
ncbi:hypothetical protein J437_LFUL000244 [Ladona fulva]|uniref:Uncharacterized protein n=1 Tax=Ladona fulva TaxID=123851 RepID=A0A8K0NX29_LADFU|nr:hypothetical protein J437_LFUL000244 [Ladona fulva]